MGKYLMPKNKKELEDMLINAFDAGMQCGYGVEHTELSDDERVYRNRYRALIQGKINGLDEIINDEKLLQRKKLKKMSETEIRRYFCNIEVNSTFNVEKGYLSEKDIKELKNLISNTLFEWLFKMYEKGLSVSAGWSWTSK